MKFGFFIAILLAIVINDPLRISRINKLKSQAKAAFNAGDFQGAIEKYKILTDSMQVTEDEVILNLAHAYYLAKDTAHAFPAYQGLTSSLNDQVSSKANQQLGVMSNVRGKAEEALNYFKQAIKADPQNELARYNYEMLKKKLDQQRKEDEKNKDQKKDNKDKKEEPSAFAKRLKAQADQLVAQKQYAAAFELMMNGLKRDKTVSTYQDYIERIKTIADINK
jgi:tetratricopeptide (TPR) repeat protein